MTEQAEGRVLLVEDNDANRDMLARRLRREGFEVITAVDGAQAVQLALQERPDIILMDMSLPVLDGIDATRKIKASLSMRRVPIIALTAHTLPAERERCLAAGCDDFQAKPIDLLRLIGSMRALLGGARPSGHNPIRGAG
jgi:two-component system, cell cycle response regulator DivK